MNEIWVTIKDWPNYEISNFGNVRSIERVENFRGTLRKRKSTMMKPHLWSAYLTVNLKDYGRNKRYLIHRLVAAHFCENPDNKNVVNHKDKNGFNNRADNLEWVTQKENIHHAMQFEDWTRGENNGNAKLTKEDIIEIRKHLLGCWKTAKLYNVSKTTILRIRSGKIWAHV
jgi:hypothetical protein